MTLPVTTPATPTLESSFCVAALDRALCAARPEVFNSDQGSQFTSLVFTERLKAQGIAISMDGRGRALDNIFVERLWRNVKYEEVYLKDYRHASDAMKGLQQYFEFYNRSGCINRWITRRRQRSTGKAANKQWRPP